MTVFQATKNDAVHRLTTVVATGDDTVDAPEWNTDIEQVARDRIAAHILETFAGHGLAELIAAILTAEGCHCVVSPPGSDGGVDIHAGRGPLGLDSPLVLAQVKSDRTPIGAPVVTQLHGVMGTHGAEQGLLVAWGGLSKAANAALGNHHLRVRVWDEQDIVDAVFRTYDHLHEKIRSTIPLKRVWMLVDDTNTD
jgi:restriction system protein